MIKMGMMAGFKTKKVCENAFKMEGGLYTLHNSL